MKAQNTRAFLPEEIQLLNRIGRGGQATVYKAKIANFKQLVAVKVFKQEMLSYSSYKRELIVLSHANHRSIVKLFGHLSDHRQAGLVIELLHGTTGAVLLNGLIRHSLSISPLLARYIFQEVLLPLAQVHAGFKNYRDFSNGIIHGDLAPDNLYFSESGEIKLIDFGATIFKIVNCTKPVPFGKRKYLSPEQLSGNYISIRSDLYSLGLIMYELLTQRPFELSCSMQNLKLLQDFLHDTNKPMFLVLKACLSPSPFFRPKNAKHAYKLLDKMTNLEIQAAKSKLASLVKITQKQFR